MKKVSVIITTYNHQNYIMDAIESVLMQKGNFFLEIIIGDDHSKDETLRIAKKYKDNHPEIITMISASENLGVTENIKRCIKLCSGDYIAFLEGDDYWTSDSKIEQQISLLERHPEKAFCFNAIELLYEETEIITSHPLQDQLIENDKLCLTISDLIKDNFIGNFSCCLYRKNVVDQLPDDLFEMYVVDWMFNICCAKSGFIGFLPKKMSVYRIHEGGAWSSQKQEQKLLSWLRYAVIYDNYLNREYKADFIVLKAKLLEALLGNLSKSWTTLPIVVKYWWISHINIFEYLKIMAGLLRNK